MGRSSASKIYRNHTAEAAMLCIAAEAAGHLFARHQNSERERERKRESERLFYTVRAWQSSTKKLFLLLLLDCCKVLEHCERELSGSWLWQNREIGLYPDFCGKVERLRSIIVYNAVLVF